MFLSTTRVYEEARHQGYLNCSRIKLGFWRWKKAQLGMESLDFMTKRNINNIGRRRMREGAIDAGRSEVAFRDDASFGL